MTPKQKKRLFALAVVLCAGIGVAVLLVFALSQNINLFYTPSQIKMGEVSGRQWIRVGGLVVVGSVVRDPDSLQVRFDLSDLRNTITVTYNGILPDLFREGQGIVAQGRVDNNGRLVATQVLAKHDENYMPPEVARSIAKSQASSYREKSP